MSNRSRVRLVAWCAALAGALVVACFSDHSVTGVPAGTGTCQFPDSPDVEGSTVVTISNYAFHPAQVHVRRGSRVTWVNCEAAGGLGHTSTANGGGWASPLVTPGTAFTQVFDAPGTFDYHCEPHPFMQGSVVVE